MSFFLFLKHVSLKNLKLPGFYSCFIIGDTIACKIKGEYSKSLISCMASFSIHWFLTKGLGVFFLNLPSIF